MSQRRAKKKKKAEPNVVIRTDVWELVATDDQKHLMMMTVEEYRAFLHPLVLIVNAQWTNLVELPAKDKVNSIERMFHATAKNPELKHQYFQKVREKHPSFRKFPSYLRRAAIAEAIGIVSSFNTRYQAWHSRDRKHRLALPPSLTAMCKAYPCLYKGQQILYYNNYSHAELKVWDGKNWIWLTGIKIKKHGQNRHLVDGNQIMSPSLVVNYHKCQLSMPVDIKRVVIPDSDFVCSVDLGINNAATASIVGRDGTVKARLFINPARDIDRRDKRRMTIARKAKKTSRITGEKFTKGATLRLRQSSAQGLPKGFAKGLYRKSSHINLEISRTVALRIVNFASSHNVKVIVLENLSGWKAKGGRKHSLMKQRFHQWCHAKIVETVTHRWKELGGKVQTINPKYTSAYAFDGSGKLTRDSKNYSLARFRNGKRYNADLSASYNIGARFWYCVLMGDRNFSRVNDRKSSDDTSRTPELSSGNAKTASG